MYLKTKLAFALIISLPLMPSYAAKDTSGDNIDLTAIEARVSALESLTNPSVAGSTYRVVTLTDVALSSPTTEDLILYFTVGAPAQQFQQFAFTSLYTFVDDVSGAVTNPDISACSAAILVNIFVQPPFIGSLDAPSPCRNLPPSFHYSQTGSLIEINFGVIQQSFSVSSNGGIIARSQVVHPVAPGFPSPEEAVLGEIAIGVRVGN
jgi:hypothetical protein